MDKQEKFMGTSLQLTSTCEETRNAVSNGVNWLKENQTALNQDTVKLQKHLKLNAFKANKLMWASQRKPGIGVFGASQAGKSYLVSTLASKTTNRLMAVFGNNININFIKSINPEGGKESTGVVTRFTLDKPKTPQTEYPVCLDLLSLTDVIKILANTYVFDLRHENDTDDAHDPKKINQRLKDLEASVSIEPISSMCEEDIIDLEQYCLHKLGNKNSNRRIAALTSVDFWNRASRIAPHLSNSNLTRLFGLLWEDLQAISKIFNQLLAALTQLNHSREAYCTLEGLCKIDNGKYSRWTDGSIIDVETLLKRGMGEENEQRDNIAVRTKAGNPVHLPRNVLTALVAELVITMKEKPADFFENTDLLDFPGARSREIRVKDPAYLDNAKTRPRLFLRGKVAYLFERYCDNKDLTSLLLCSSFENPNVISLPEMVFDWISTTHGSTPEKRAQLDTSLFLILTKFDVTAFKQSTEDDDDDDDNDSDNDFSIRWATRIENSLIQPYSEIPNDWPNHWQKEGQAFNNCFCVRNPTIIQDQIFEYAKIEGRKQEIDIRPSKREFINLLKQSFTESPLLQTHLYDVEKAWDALMELNDGGISLLLSRLETACKPHVKEQQISKLISEIRTEIKKKLDIFYVTGNLDEELAKKLALAKKIRISLNRTKDRFPEFISLLQIKEDTLYDIYTTVKNTFDTSSGPSNINSLGGKDQTAATAPVFEKEDGDPFDNMFDDDVGDTPHKENETGSVSDKNDIDIFDTSNHTTGDFASRYIAAVKERWDLDIIELSDSQEILDYFGVEKQLLLDVSQEILLGMQRTNLFEKMTNQVRKIIQRREVDAEAQDWKTISPIFYEFNEFINWLGFGGSSAPKGTTISLKNIFNKDKEHTVFACPEPPVEYPELTDTAPDFGKKYLVDWLVGFTKLMHDNVPFYLNIKIKVDAAMNNQLGNILKKLT